MRKSLEVKLALTPDLRQRQINWLRDENARYRMALEQIADHSALTGCDGNCAEFMFRVANAALGRPCLLSDNSEGQS